MEMKVIVGVPRLPETQPGALPAFEGRQQEEAGKEAPDSADKAGKRMGGGN